MDKKLAEKLIADEHFITFCSLVNIMKERGYRVGIPLDTALMLYDAGVDFLRGEGNLEVIHNAVAEFLEPGRESETVDFYGYIVSVLGIV